MLLSAVDSSSCWKWLYTPVLSTAPIPSKRRTQCSTAHRRVQRGWKSWTRIRSCFQRSSSNLEAGQRRWTGIVTQLFFPYIAGQQRRFGMLPHEMSCSPHECYQCTTFTTCHDEQIWKHRISWILYCMHSESLTYYMSSSADMISIIYITLFDTEDRLLV